MIVKHYLFFLMLTVQFLHKLCYCVQVIFYIELDVWVHAVNGRVFTRSNKYTF